jgi:hypothetical protein
MNACYLVMTASLMGFWGPSCAQAQTQIGLSQLPSCIVPAGLAPGTTMILALAPGSATSFACYVLSGVTIVPATATNPATLLIPSSSALPNFVTSEVPAGTINGTNAAFTLANATPLGVMVFRNGLLQSPLADYTISGNMITFSAVSIPQTKDTLQVSYHF